MGLNAQPSGEAYISAFRSAQCGQIQRGKPRDRTNTVHCFRCQGHDHRSGAEGDGTAPLSVRWLSLTIPGIDDEGALGAERVRRSSACWKRRILRFLSRTARAVLQPAEQELIELFRKREIPFVIAHNKADLTSVPAAMPEKRDLRQRSSRQQHP